MSGPQPPASHELIACTACGWTPDPQGSAVPGTPDPARIVAVYGDYSPADTDAYHDAVARATALRKTAYGHTRLARSLTARTADVNELPPDLEAELVALRGAATACYAAAAEADAYAAAFADLIVAAARGAGVTDIDLDD